MRQIDHIVNEGKFLKKIKKFFAPLTDAERKAAGIQDRNAYLAGKDVKPLPTPKKFKTDKSGTVRSRDRYGEPGEEKTKEKANEAVVSEADEPTDKATEVQQRISSITKQLTHMRKSWDANSSRVRKERKRLSGERDSHVRDARALANQREAADKARSKVN
tara:strand:+ start:31 stop:513 length:483 start_codon:yes stop_codon:yes gene_type:complete